MKSSTKLAILTPKKGTASNLARPLVYANTEELLDYVHPCVILLVTREPSPRHSSATREPSPCHS